MRELKKMSGGDERTTTVMTQDLLEKLVKNREEHLKEYEEAVSGYLKEATSKIKDEYKLAQEKLDKAYKRTKSELSMFDPEKAHDTIVFCESIRFHLVAPRNFLDAYDQAIEMMKWEVGETVELNTTEFRCFVLNKWDWMDEFKMSTSNYNSRG